MMRYKEQPDALSWKNIEYQIKVGKKEHRTILNNVSGSISSGEMVAILGSSGAGKTTLLNILAGRAIGGRLRGEILFNGMKRIPHLFKKQISYVQQEDLLYPFLTVEETLQFASTLRLPSKDFTNKEKEDRVHSVIDTLMLRKAAKTKIGNELVRGVSGGEKKRVSIGIELLTEPDILFLDEPTSGLDSFAALSVCETLKSIAVNQNKAILMTIHQPSARIFELFDKIILLANGRTVFEGTLSDALDHFSSLGFTCPQHYNPADFFVEQITIDQTSEEKSRASLTKIDSLIQTFATSQDSSKLEQGDPSVSLQPNVVENHSHNLNWFEEFTVLYKRALIDTIRNWSRLIGLLAQTIFLSIIIGLTYFNLSNDQPSIQNRLGLIFFVSTNAAFSIVTPLLSIFSLDRAILIRERACKTYRVSTFYISKFMIEFPIGLFFQIIVSSGIYLISNLSRDVGKYLIFIAVISCLVFCSTALAFAVSSAVKKVQLADIISVTLLILLLLYGGNLVNNDDVLDVFLWIRYISFIQYSYQALMQNEFKGLKFDCGNSPNCLKDGSEVLEQFNVNEFSIGYCFLYMLIIGLAIFIIGYVFLRNRTRLRSIWI